MNTYLGPGAIVPLPSPASDIASGFEIVSGLGRGATAYVYRARQLGTGRPVALKVMKAAASAIIERRFRREVCLLGALRHPNIVWAIDAGLSGQRPYIAMELVEGRTLAELVDGDGPLAEGRALAVARDICRAIDYAARRGVVHRDIKPENVLIGPDGRARLCDFGLAARIEQTQPACEWAIETTVVLPAPAAGRVVDPRSGLGSGGKTTQDGFLLGTPCYLAPERIRGCGYYDVRGDVYSLGIMLVHALIGRPPIDGRTAAEILKQHRTVGLPDPLDLGVRLSPGCRLLIRKMCAHDSRERALPGELLPLLDDLLARPLVLPRGCPRLRVARRAVVGLRRRAALPFGAAAR